jgi:hypothetical protein
MTAMSHRCPLEDVTLNQIVVTPWHNFDEEGRAYAAAVGHPDNLHARVQISHPREGCNWMVSLAAGPTTARRVLEEIVGHLGGTLANPVAAAKPYVRRPADEPDVVQLLCGLCDDLITTMEDGEKLADLQDEVSDHLALYHADGDGE